MCLGVTCGSNNLQLSSKYPLISRYNPLNCRLLGLQIGFRMPFIFILVIPRASTLHACGA